jgi:hypothetical protein
VLAVGGECLAHFAHELFLITTIRLLYLPWVYHWSHALFNSCEWFNFSLYG